MAGRRRKSKEGGGWMVREKVKIEDISKPAEQLVKLTLDDLMPLPPP